MRAGASLTGRDVDSVVKALRVDRITDPADGFEATASAASIEKLSNRFFDQLIRSLKVTRFNFSLDTLLEFRRQAYIHSSLPSLYYRFKWSGLALLFEQIHLAEEFFDAAADLFAFGA